jgi:NADH-quinone oxidoreductase subunit J
LVNTKFLFAFELTSALLIVAAVGAMVLAHIEREGPKRSQKAIARERIRSGRPQPLPGPGVLSTGNSVATPALLPDGTVSRESVMVGVSEWEPVGFVNRALDPADVQPGEVRETEVER